VCRRGVNTMNYSPLVAYTDPVIRSKIVLVRAKLEREHRERHRMDPLLGLAAQNTQLNMRDTTHNANGAGSEWVTGSVRYCINFRL